MEKFTVSLIISTYNNPRYLAFCLRSLLQQSVMPDEVLIADDGSGAETRRLIEEFRPACPAPLVHVWHEDTGFRKAAITNRAMAAAKGEYLIIVDGDMVYHPELIRDHVEHARAGCFLCGSQTRLGKRTTMRLFKRNTTRVPWWVRWTVFNAMRIPWMMDYMLTRYKQGSKYEYRTVRGGHMSIWRDDVLAVNGYDEHFEGWGYEDTDFGVRLRHAGFKMLNLKFGAIIFHLWHGENSRARGEENRLRAMHSIETKAVRAENGIDKYL